MGTVEANKKDRLDMLAKIPGIIVHKYMYRNNGDLTFTDQSVNWGLSSLSFSNGAAYADLDNDGDLDLVTNNIDEAATVLRNSKNNSPDVNTPNFLRIGFIGPPLNREGLGAKVYLRNKGTLQYQYFTPFRGFLSSVEPFVHFGLGNTGKIDSLEVIWPDGNTQILRNVKSDQVLMMKYSDARPQEKKIEKTAHLLFTEATETSGIKYAHVENDFVDFKVQPLLPHMHSRNGPGITVGDVNGDGLDDFYVGGASGQAGALYMQKTDGKFKRQSISKIDSLSDELGVLLFDADRDGDNDLYIVSGGTEHEKGSALYADHLYLNDGSGELRPEPTALPDIRQSGSCVMAADYDHDGDLDLFIGGRIIPGEYALPADSYLLRNDWDGKVCRFTDVTKSIAVELLKVGLVTTGLWTDVDNDGWTDLLLAGEFMPITYFRNKEGKNFVKMEIPALVHSSGWWNSLTAGDFDQDGDMDYIAGNLGLNTRYKATVKEPLCINTSDYDKNGSVDPVMSLYIDGEKQIAHSWDDMVKQMNPIRARFRTYEPYAEANFQKSFLPAEIAASYEVCSEWFETSYLENKGNGDFALTPLPVQLQFSPVYGATTGDYDHDGHLDVLLIGNSYATEASTGRYDAAIGWYLRGDGKGKFTSVVTTNTGFMVDQDAKGLCSLIAADGRELILAGINNGKLKAHITHLPEKYFTPGSGDAYAIIKLKNGRSYKHEFYYGSTYLSNSTRKMPLPDAITEIVVYDFSGNKRIVIP